MFVLKRKIWRAFYDRLNIDEWQGKTMLKLEDVKLAIVGLGYVGLPLAVEFGKKNASRRI
ncbi:hypothetical protein AB7M25_001646 [Pseudomonas sp. AP3_22 TE3818]